MIEVLKTAGRMLIKTVSNIESGINVSNLDAGMYLLKITALEGSTVKPFIKK